MISGGYLLAVFIHSFSKHSWRFADGKIEHTVLLLVLWFISAFALNREMNVFESSVNWLCVWIVLSAIVVTLASWYRAISKSLNYVVFFLLGTALLLFTYYAIYLIPLYLISIIGIVAIGISLHTYVPVCLAIVAVVLILRASQGNRSILYSAVAGFMLPLLFAVYYLINWNLANNKMNLLINQNALSDTKVPAWVYVSQHIEKSALVERILKVGLVYHEVSNGNVFWGGIPSRSFDEPKQHDPLVILATLLFKKPNLDETDRVNVLKSIYNSRHQAQERLWSGDKLETISVISNVKLFPEYRIAYTEKTLTVRSNAISNWSQQEAIYTFHLAEGSVVSSLSLWINGHEEKSRLTTKAKADSAYHEIVGVERHDPSVVHWQEGNIVSVRVFPCTPGENRKFKIGITSPLSKQGDQLVYENAFFDGPDATGALETMQITYAGEAKGLQLPSVFKQITPGVYQTDRTYEPDWNITCKAPELANTVFSFADTTYQVKNYKEKYEPFTPDKIYLDLNNSWTKAEFDQVWMKVSNKPVYVFAGKLIKLNKDNRDEIYRLMAEQNFSLFPVNEIAEPEKALLISKNTVNAPNLSDLDGSDFSAELTGYLKTPKHIRFYNIGQELTPYLKALKEFRVLNYADGSTGELARLLDRHQFIQDQENDQTVVIENAGLMIQKTAGLPTQNAPDHLLRLFAYNDIMKKVGANFFKKDYVHPNIIAEAEQAYIVSPVSSAIVLETQKDYERFGISENKDSLKNASMKSSGAVPEPHEWALLLMALSIVVYITRNKKFANQAA
jgi:XrtN system VIT domain protein